MGSVDDAKTAVVAAQEALATASTVLTDVEGETTVNNRTVTGVTIHYSDDSTAEFILEDAATGLPPTDAATAAAESDASSTSTTEDAGTSSTDTTPADASGESTATAPDAPAGTIPG